jgi:hypothetical protein
VDRAFALTLDELHDPALRITTGGHAKSGKSGHWPVYLGEPQGAEVWGLTAFILSGVLRELITPLRDAARLAESEASPQEPLGNAQSERALWKPGGGTELRFNP